MGSTNFPAGTCNAGVCSTQGAACPNSFGCKADQTGCNQTCNGNADCAAGKLCLLMPHVCVGCGTSPPPPYMCTPGSGGCESCDANGTCDPTMGMQPDNAPVDFGCK